MNTIPLIVLQAIAEQFPGLTTYCCHSFCLDTTSTNALHHHMFLFPPIHITVWYTPLILMLPSLSHVWQKSDSIILWITNSAILVPTHVSLYSNIFLRIIRPLIVLIFSKLWNPPTQTLCMLTVLALSIFNTAMSLFLWHDMLVPTLMT